jgi:hypothetical protein
MCAEEGVKEIAFALQKAGEGSALQVACVCVCVYVCMCVGGWVGVRRGERPSASVCACV